tara:strand:+ start:180 stop:491 length:312 start_codon:yes stop_codon:yes gene_type:complete
MLEYRVVESNGRHCIGLNENDFTAFQECCEIIEAVFKTDIKEVEDIPVPVSLADLHRTYHLNHGQILIDLDEAWGIDISSSYPSILKELVKGYEHSAKFTKIT